MLTEIEAVDAVIDRLKGESFPAQAACVFAGQTRVRTWGVNLGLKNFIPVKAAYLLVLRKLDPAYGGGTNSFATSEAKRFFKKVGRSTKALPASYWDKYITDPRTVVEREIPDFREGQVYQLSYLNELFGGQEQRGIITPTSTPVVIAITAPAGRKHDYHDTWTDDGVFLYYGEGRNRDMMFQAGNKAIRDHVEDGKALLVFEKKAKGKYAFLGNFVCAGYSEEKSSSAGRKGLIDIIFQLVPANSLAEAAAAAEPPPKTDLYALRQAAMDASGGAKRSRSKGAGTSAFRRAADIVVYVNARANGLCECCDEPSPFKRDDSSPYLEAHHINRLVDGGLDHPLHVAAVCPNCHRAAHHSAERRKINADLAERIRTKEAKIEAEMASAKVATSTPVPA
jgi:5-methylcytosine-specific restriction protein A